MNHTMAVENKFVRGKRWASQARHQPTRYATISPTYRAALEARYPIPSIESLITKYTGRFSGDALGKQLTKSLSKDIGWVSYPETIGACFPAGTKVHTDKGLVSIEDLKIGDLVLSRPEQGGELAYKRVVKTLAFDDKTLREITYHDEANERYVSIVATGNHPFWAIEEQGHVDENGDEWQSKQYVRGWIAAEHLLPDGTRLAQLDDGTIPELYQDARHHHLMQLADGRLVRIVQNTPIYRTAMPGCGWVRELGSFEHDGAEPPRFSWRPVGLSQADMARSVIWR